VQSVATGGGFLSTTGITKKLMRHVSRWKHSFSRLAGVVRASVWLRRNVVELLESFGANGTARGGIRAVDVARPLYLQAFLPFDAGPMGQHE